MPKELIDPRSPRSNLIELVMQETKRVITTASWREASGGPDIPSVTYAHLIGGRATFPQEVAPLLMRKPLLTYLHAQLDPHGVCSLTLRLLAVDGRTLASYGGNQPLQTISAQAWQAPTLVQEEGSDFSQGTFPIPLNPQVPGSLALCTPVPLFFTGDRVHLITRYAELASLAFPEPLLPVHSASCGKGVEYDR